MPLFMDGVQLPQGQSHFEEAGCKPDKFESHNSLKLSFTNICGLCLNFVECESFLELNFHDILVVCETKLDDSIDSGSFSQFLLIRKDSITHKHVLTVYVKEELFFLLKQQVHF